MIWPRAPSWMGGAAIRFACWLAWISASAGVAVCAEELREYRLRVAWGGATRVAWRGSFRVKQGHVVQFHPLGTDPDVPGTLRRTSRGLVLEPLRPVPYQAADLVISGSEDARLQVRLGRAGEEQFLVSRDFELRAITASHEAVRLDDTGNSLLIQPIPGDQLRVDVGRDHLVFSPGETWNLDVEPPHELRRLSKASITATLTDATTARVVWRTQSPIQAAAGQTQLPRRARLAITIPQREGVFNLRLNLVPLNNSLLPGVRGKSVEREVQLVVIEAHRPVTQRGESDPGRWPSVMDFDPTEPRWWEQWVALPAWHQLPGEFGTLIREGTAKPWDHDGRPFTRLEAGGWQAYPLAIRRTNEPHVVEIECPAKLSQAMAVCIVEADSDGEFLSRIASGAFVRTVAPGEPQLATTYPLLFWPRTKRPAVVLINLRQDRAAAFGPINVRNGPPGLPPLAPWRNPVGQREALAHFDEPQLIDMFSAPESLDRPSGRLLTDWTTFLVSARRLAEYLQFVGYTGASIGCWSDGAGWTPISTLQGAARFDTGPFLSNGQDPIRKDVWELLHRVFDRDGLRLVAGLRLTSRLPELELLRADSKRGVGLELVHRDGRSWREGVGQGQSLGPFYNPMDPRVQDAIRGIARTVVQRYGHHPSFAGIRLDLDVDTYTQLPDEHWGYDPVTVARFVAETGKRGTAARGLPTPEELLGGALRDPWLKWRADQVSRLYEGILEEIQTARPEARLYFSASGLMDAPQVRRTLTPALPRVRGLPDAFLGMGIDVPRWTARRGVVFSRPVIAPGVSSLVAQGPMVELFRDTELDQLFERAALPSTQSIQPSCAVSLPSLESASARTLSPAVPARPPRRIVTPVDDLDRAPLEASIRGLAFQDASFLQQGGLRPSLGSLLDQRALLRVFRELPAARAEYVTSPGKEVLVLKKIVLGDRTILFAVNPTPWPLEAEVRLQAPPEARFVSLPVDLASDHQRLESGILNWTLKLDGLQLAAAVVTSPALVVDGVETQPPLQAQAELRAAITDLIGRTGQLRSVAPAVALPNAGMEATETGEGIPGWSVFPPNSLIASRDVTQARSGKASLHLRSLEQGGGIHSSPLNIPPSGRLAVQIYVRRSPASSSSLRLVIEGKHLGIPLSRYAEIPPGQLTTAWAPYVLQVSDLPDENLDELRVRFDLTGPGEVWIDDVQLFNLSFTPVELNELAKLMALADLQLSDGNLFACRETLLRYWPRYLLEMVPPPPLELARQPEPPQTPSARPEQPPGWFDRMRGILPYGTRR